MKNYTYTDSGNAERIVDKFSDILRYVGEEGMYYLWDGKRWVPDKNNQVQELAKTLPDDINAEADELAKALVATEDEAKERDKKVAKIRGWANRSGMAATITASLKMASSIPQIIVSKDLFNKHTDLLNCNNGIVDLKTGKLMAHDRNLYLSQMCPWDYEPEAKSDDWENIIKTITTNHPEMASALQVFVGYGAQGNKGKEKIVLCHGPGGGGKGTLWNLIQKTLGSDFVRTVSANSLLKADRNGGAASGDIARMEGARIVLASEFDSQKKLEDNFLKLASGNDTIVARQLYAEEREFKPTFQIIFQSNHRPKFDGADTGNRRRYLEFPFDYVIPNPDPTIKQRMESSPDVMKSILAWIVAGSVRYFQLGDLEYPDCVKAATAELLNANDALAEFFDACVVVDKDMNTPLTERSRLPVTDLKDAYVAYCHKESAEPFKPQTFNRMLEDRGFRRKDAAVDKKVVKCWLGISLTEVGKRLITTEEEMVTQVQSKYAEMQKRKKAC